MLIIYILYIYNFGYFYKILLNAI